MKITKILSLVLSILILTSLAIPVGAFATDEVWLEEPVEEWFVESFEDYETEVLLDEYYNDQDDVYSDNFFEEYPEYTEDNSFEEPFIEEYIEEPVSEETVFDEELFEEFTFQDNDTFQASGLEITKDPEPFYGAWGETATFTVVATGTGTLKYQWQWSSDGVNWENTGVTGNKTDTITLQITSARDGNLYRCVVTDDNGNTATSNGALLTIASAPVITAQPEAFEGAEGETATFTVAATGSGTLKYQWQWSSDGTNWQNAGLTGNKTDTLTVPVTKARNGLQYRCVVTDGNGKTTASNGALLTIAGDFVFEVTSDTTARLKKYYGKDANVTVDSTYNGKTVTEIGEAAFENNTVITSVSLPNSITVIGKRAFAGCTNLSSMTTHD